MRILGIDPGLRHCGYAQIERGASAWHVTLSGTIEEDGPDYLAFNTVVRSMHDLIGTAPQPELVLVEAPAFRINQGRPIFQMVYGAVLAVAAIYRLPWVPVSPTTVKATPVAKSIAVKKGPRKAEAEAYTKAVAAAFHTDLLESPDACDAALVAEVGRLCVSAKRVEDLGGVPSFATIRDRLADWGVVDRFNRNGELL